MAGSVEAVAADAVFLIILMRNRIKICFFRHGHTEGRIKYGYIRNARHRLLTGFDTHQVRRIVKRSKIKTLTDGSFYILVYLDRFGKLDAAVQYTVSYCGDLAGILDYAVLRIYQSLHNQGNRLCMLRHGLFHYQFFAICLMSQLGTFDSDSLAETLCHYALIIHINQLIFQRGASAV